MANAVFFLEFVFLRIVRGCAYSVFYLQFSDKQNAVVVLDSRFVAVARVLFYKSAETYYKTQVAFTSVIDVFVIMFAFGGVLCLYGRQMVLGGGFVRFIRVSRYFWPYLHIEI
jgi:aromatic ring hydroxylase